MIAEIRRCKNINDIYEIIIENSYDIKSNNYHQKQDYKSCSNWKYAEGYYLVPKRRKSETESHLDTLCESIKKRLMKIYSNDIKETGDKEFYETMSYTELFFTLKELENKYGFQYILDKFEDVDSVNQFSGFIVSIIANRNMKVIQKNKSNTVIAQAKKINNKTIWEYSYLSFVDLDGTKKDDKSDQVYSMYEYIVKNNISYANSEESGLYNSDNYEGFNTNEIPNDNILSYLASKINLLTTSQQDYLTNNSTKRNYQMDKKIYERLVKKLSNDKNIEIKLDLDGKLIDIKLKENYFSILEVILSQRNNKTMFLKLIEVIKKNNRYSDRLMDLILDCDTKFYAPIINYLNDEKLNLDYINNKFNHILYKLKLNL